jgi:hypothetical protein
VRLRLRPPSDRRARRARGGRRALPTTAGAARRGRAPRRAPAPWRRDRGRRRATRRRRASVPAPRPPDGRDDVRHRPAGPHHAPAVGQGYPLLLVEDGFEVCFVDHVLRSDLARSQSSRANPAPDGLGVTAGAARRFRNGEHGVAYYYIIWCRTTAARRRPVGSAALRGLAPLGQLFLDPLYVALKLPEAGFAGFLPGAPLLRSPFLPFHRPPRPLRGCPDL